MTCDEIRRHLTGYLDGDLEASRGSAVRGHLRGCAACRAVAGDEAALRDGLRALPPLDPPASLWAGVQRQLADAEIADAERPRWRRALSRWLPYAPRFGMAGAALAAAAALLVWRAHRNDEQVAIAPPPPPATQAPHEAHAPRPTAPPLADDDLDVSDALAAEPARRTAAYADVSKELLALAGEARARWTDDRKRTFDGKVAALRARIDQAAEGRPRQQAYRELNHYLQSVAVRDEVASNDRVFAGGCP